MMGLVERGDIITAKTSRPSVQFRVHSVCENGTLDVRRIRREEGAGADEEPPTENVRIEDAKFELKRLEEILVRGSPFLCLKWESPKEWTKYMVRREEEGGALLSIWMGIRIAYCRAIAVCTTLADSN